MKHARQSQPIERPSRAGSLDLVGGALALDLTNTSSGRGTPGHQEHLRDFDTVMQWVAHARILTPADCAYVRAAAASRPKLARAFFQRLLEIRELIWMIATAPRSAPRAPGERLRGAEVKMWMPATSPGMMEQNPNRLENVGHSSVAAQTPDPGFQGA